MLFSEILYDKKKAFGYFEGGLFTLTNKNIKIIKEFYKSFVENEEEYIYSFK